MSISSNMDQTSVLMRLSKSRTCSIRASPVLVFSEISTTTRSGRAAAGFEERLGGVFRALPHNSEILIRFLGDELGQPEITISSVIDNEIRR